jgi:hypothetical protein
MEDSRFENVTVAQMAKNFVVFYGPVKSLPCSQEPNKGLDSVLSQLNSVSIFTPYFLKIVRSALILSSHLRLNLPFNIS